jgi:hypothetical protein
MKITKSELKNLIREALKEELKRSPLKEGRSVADIEAEIARLQRELADAKVAEKRAAIGDKAPAFVWAWDMYLDPADKGTWVSIDNDTVFETKEAALDAGWLLLNELEDQNDLDEYGEGIEPDDYHVEAYKIPISKVSTEVLKWSKLDHLISGDAEPIEVECAFCYKDFKISQAEWDSGSFTCPHCHELLMQDMYE